MKKPISYLCVLVERFEGEAGACDPGTGDSQIENVPLKVFYKLFVFLGVVLRKPIYEGFFFLKGEGLRACSESSSMSKL